MTSMTSVGHWYLEQVYSAGSLGSKARAVAEWLPAYGGFAGILASLTGIWKAPVDLAQSLAGTAGASRTIGASTSNVYIRTISSDFNLTPTTLPSNQQSRSSNKTLQ